MLDKYSRTIYIQSGEITKPPKSRDDHQRYKYQRENIGGRRTNAEESMQIPLSTGHINQCGYKLITTCLENSLSSCKHYI